MGVFRCAVPDAVFVVVLAGLEHRYRINGTPQRGGGHGRGEQCAGLQQPGDKADGECHAGHGADLEDKPQALIGLLLLLIDIGVHAGQGAEHVRGQGDAEQRAIHDAGKCVAQLIERLFSLAEQQFQHQAVAAAV